MYCLRQVVKTPTIICNNPVLISFKYDINIIGAAFCIVINSVQFSHLNPFVIPGNHQWSGAAALSSKRGVQIIIGVYRFLSNVSRSSVNVFTTTIKSGVLLRWALVQLVFYGNTIYSVLQKNGLNFVSLYFKIRTSVSNDMCSSLLEFECWNEDKICAAQQSPTQF